MNLIVQCELIFEVDNWVSKVVGSDKMLRKLFFKQDIWGISINQYEQGDLLDSTVMKPTITAGDVKDCKAIFVADPFWKPFFFQLVVPFDFRQLTRGVSCILDVTFNC